MMLNLGTVFIVLNILVATHCQELGPEILVNPDFEDDDFSGNWFCNGCSLEVYTADVQDGEKSVKITSRTGTWSGITQDLDPTLMKQNHRFYFTSKMKLLNEVPGTLFQNAEMWLKIVFVDNSQKYIGMAKRPMLTYDDKWFTLGADFQMPDKEPLSVRLYIQKLDTSINYLVDSTSLKEIYADESWREKSDANIDKYRKSKLTVSVDVGENMDKEKVKIHIIQKTHAFPFGTAVRYQPLVEEQKYRDFLKAHFNYAVIENVMKWKQIEWTEDNIRQWRVDECLDILEDIGIPVRAHNVFWGVEKNCPNWLLTMSGEEVSTQIDRRLDYAVESVKGRVAHWDVNNENLHGTFFEDKTNDPDITSYMFQGVRERDSDVKLFLNEYQVVNQGAVTEAYLSQAESLLEASVDLYGIGAQSHIPENTAPDPTNLMWRLNILAKAGIPIWITELTTESWDENLRADWYETCLRVYFGHPQVEGILIWGFWDQFHYSSAASLVTGPNLEPNAAGERWIDLIHNEWNTTVTHALSDGEEVSGRYFHGDYNIVITYDDNTIHEQTFTLGKQDLMIVVSNLCDDQNN